MTSILPGTDVQRQRWHRARHGLRLTDPEAEDFASGGLARLVREQTVRLLILPPDPEAYLIDFDEPFWRWWTLDSPDPVTGSAAQWGSDIRPVAAAALRGRLRGDGEYYSYLALHRHGGIELELGYDGTYTLPNSTRVFRLLRTVGRVWAALGLYRGIIDRLTLDGPWELSIA